MNSLFLFVIAIMKNAHEAAAICIPKQAASLKTDQYRVIPLTKWVRYAYPYNHADSAFVNPIFCCFQVHIAENRHKHAHTIKYLLSISGEEI